jgi:hypothetical protein
MSDIQGTPNTSKNAAIIISQQRLTRGAGRDEQQRDQVRLGIRGALLQPRTLIPRIEIEYLKGHYIKIVNLRKFPRCFMHNSADTILRCLQGVIVASTVLSLCASLGHVRRRCCDAFPSYSGCVHIRTS